LRPHAGSAKAARVARGAWASALERLTESTAPVRIVGIAATAAAVASRPSAEWLTTAAARYLEDLYSTDAQASGLLVLASYNMGDTRLRKLLRSLPESPAERNYWVLLGRHRAQIPAETQDYVLRIIAAAAIGEDPKLFGFEVAGPLRR